MKLGTRQIATGLGVAAAAILLPTAALAASSGPAAPAAKAAAGARTATTPFCKASQTEVWYAVPGDGTAGSIYYEFEISNISHRTCQLFGYPGVSALNAHGHQVGLPASHSGRRVEAIL